MLVAFVISALTLIDERRVIGHLITGFLRKVRCWDCNSTQWLTPICFHLCLEVDNRALIGNEECCFWWNFAVKAVASGFSSDFKVIVHYILIGLLTVSDWLWPWFWEATGFLRGCTFLFLKSGNSSCDACSGNPILLIARSDQSRQAKTEITGMQQRKISQGVSENSK